MSQVFDAYHDAVMHGLPDPDRDRQFYDGVLGRRFVAWIVDVVVILAIGVPLALAFGLLTLGFGLALFPMILFGVGILYRAATLASASATWGMRLMGVEFRRHDGARLDGGVALMQTLVYAFCVAVAPLMLVSALMMALTRYGQGLPDLLLRTAMINRPAD
ncbi:RDD family protein [Amaricoccus sp.]|uniref:RDD family protein n=1 Tax=Amaricoccus sp. TaxID=1872485 RepID=UPI001B501887|nr:RDD family protein [Amaricoccus sp.]MBP7001574.1 RDD family protein [Amaricoccus sp.]